jgi:hypothetical protein
MIVKQEFLGLRHLAITGTCLAKKKQKMKNRPLFKTETTQG